MFVSGWGDLIITVPLHGDATVVVVDPAELCLVRFDVKEGSAWGIAQLEDSDGRLYGVRNSAGHGVVTHTDLVLCEHQPGCDKCHVSATFRMLLLSAHLLNDLIYNISGADGVVGGQGQECAGGVTATAAPPPSDKEQLEDAASLLLTPLRLMDSLTAVGRAGRWLPGYDDRKSAEHVESLVAVANQAADRSPILERALLRDKHCHNVFLRQYVEYHPLSARNITPTFLEFHPWVPFLIQYDMPHHEILRRQLPISHRYTAVLFLEGLSDDTPRRPENSCDGFCQCFGGCPLPCPLHGLDRAFQAAYRDFAFPVTGVAEGRAEQRAVRSVLDIAFPRDPSVQWVPVPWDVLLG